MTNVADFHLAEIVGREKSKIDINRSGWTAYREHYWIQWFFVAEHCMSKYNKNSDNNALTDLDLRAKIHCRQPLLRNRVHRKTQTDRNTGMISMLPRHFRHICDYSGLRGRCLHCWTWQKSSSTPTTVDQINVDTQTQLSYKPAVIRTIDKKQDKPIN